jgi:hypothetical protein
MCICRRHVGAGVGAGFKPAPTTSLLMVMTMTIAYMCVSAREQQAHSIRSGVHHYHALTHMSTKMLALRAFSRYVPPIDINALRAKTG